MRGQLKMRSGGEWVEESVPRTHFGLQNREKSTDNLFPWAGPRPLENNLSVDSFHGFGARNLGPRHRFRDPFPSEERILGLAEQHFARRGIIFAVAEEDFGSRGGILVSFCQNGRS